MSSSVSFTNAACDGYFENFSCHLAKGESAVIVVERQEESELLCKILTGMTPLTSGTLAIDGISIADMTASERLHLRQKTSCIQHSGGLLSNLKMWENILLPSLYHNGLITAEQEQCAEDWLDFFGFSKNPMVLPATLSLFEKRMTAFIRGAIQNPLIMLYACCFDGLNDDCYDKLFTAAKRLREIHPELTSLFLTLSEETQDIFPNITAYYLHNENNNSERPS